MYPFRFITSCGATFELGSFSGVQHMEEIRAAGLELLAVNQLEVRHVLGTFPHKCGLSLVLHRSTPFASRSG